MPVRCVREAHHTPLTHLLRAGMLFSIEGDGVFEVDQRLIGDGLHAVRADEVVRHEARHRGA